MLIEEINFDSIIHLIKEKNTSPIIEDFSEYFSGFNLERVLLVTDEKIETDVRVLNQLIALRKKTKKITILRVLPNSDYTSTQKKSILKNLYLESLKKILYFPWFFILVMIHHPRLNFRTKAKQGIYNDHSYSLSEKIDTSGYTCVICNNLISASSIDIHDQVEYIYDIHELEVFRNRNKASVQRSFYIYLKEMQELNSRKNIITISSYLAKTLSNMYYYNSYKINCIYNRNFNNVKVPFNKNSYVDECLLIYVGNVSIDRGLEDIVRLSFKYDILVIACNYKEEAINYLEQNSNLNRLKIFKGMDYQGILSESIQQYRYPFFLILINPNHPSYRYALPNKFFQSQAIGCPIIAYDKTYLADIILEFKCGLIFSNKTDLNFLDGINEKSYISMKRSMEIDVGKAIEKKRL